MLQTGDMSFENRFANLPLRLSEHGVWKLALKALWLLEEEAARCAAFDVRVPFV